MTLRKLREAKKKKGPGFRKVVVPKAVAATSVQQKGGIYQAAAANP